MIAHSQTFTKVLLTIFLLGMVPCTFGQNVVDPATGRGQSFVPDKVLNGSSLGDFERMGNVKWEGNKDGITATSKQEAGKGFLLTRQSFQDVGIRALVKITGNPEVGFLFRCVRTDTATKAIMISFKESNVVAFNMTWDAKGNELKRTELRSARGIIRKAPAPPAQPENQNTNRARKEKSGPELPLPRPSTDVVAGGWNQLEVFLDLDILRAFVNDGMSSSNAVDELDTGYGSIGLYVAGAGAATISSLAYKDLAMRYTPKEETSGFSIQRISDMFYAWSATAADFNNDGLTDIASGPYIYFGPDYTRYREIYPGFTYNPSTEFPITNCQYSFDFNKDGWMDIFFGAPTGTLYLNPKGTSQRWKEHKVIPAIQSEVSVFQDVTGDNLPDLVYAAGGELRYATFDPHDPTAQWTEHIVSQAGYATAHGIGAGDINGDGRIDLVNPNGWWEQPKTGTDWIYHAVSLGRYGHRVAGLGGSVMAIYDVNGDGLNDVVTSLNAHGFGLGWFEQSKSDKGIITFVLHTIMEDYAAENAGGVTFSQLHGSTFADIDGDGITDFIVGKRCFSHLDNYFDPDPYGPPYVYWYRTVRDPKAPGGARFVPTLVHNRSGVGSDALACDLNHDGAVDIITATNRGTFIFWNNRLRDTSK